MERPLAIYAEKGCGLSITGRGNNPDRRSAIRCQPFQEKFLIAANHEQVSGHNRADTETRGLEIVSIIMQLALRT